MQGLRVGEQCPSQPNEFESVSSNRIVCQELLMALIRKPCLDGCLSRGVIVRTESSVEVGPRCPEMKPSSKFPSAD
ncbi:hypothetical protein MHYP_G00132030 [Metynnis hypsauchen]